PTHDYVFQDNQYDMVFLLERARRMGYDVWVEEEGSQGNGQKPKLHFRPSQKVKGLIYELHYGSSLNQFQPTLTTANTIDKVTVRGWDAKKKQAISYTATRSGLQTKGVGAQGRQDEIDKSIKGYEEVITDRPVHSMDEAKRLAEEILQNVAKEMVTGSG